MITHTITGKTGTSDIVLGEHFRNLEKYTGTRKYVIVADETVHKLYGELFATEHVLVIGSGEHIKTLDTVKDIYQKFLEIELDRSSCVIAVGGGIVCDIAGFAASTFLRGIPFGFVPTTLLSQVDASVGGKNGVNFQGYKNLVGVFSQPEFVLIDTDFLKTLESRTLGCGFAEAIKHGAIADPDLFSFMEEHFCDIRHLAPESIERIVNDSIVIKSSIVNQDEKEHGERRKLNFGHTFGHAIEKTLKLPHGEAIAIGMMVAANLSQQFGLLSNSDVARLSHVLELFDLPRSLDADNKAPLKEALRKDKKRYGESIKFILLEGIGKAVIQDVSIQTLEKTLECL